METEKRGLCSYDDKRYMLEDGISTLAYGHHAIESIIEEEENPSHDLVIHCLN